MKFFFLKQKGLQYLGFSTFKSTTLDLPTTLPIFQKKGTYNFMWLGPSSLQHSNDGGSQQLALQISNNLDFAVAWCDPPGR